ncbi:DUF2752 domain-containing protein [Lysobacter auxotrophicus]|uniref:DUF2752 domain-containing protein n=1 Tax=Lysobacter auxotrophicus TaxID=2992573 RepID=A0ABN6UNW8_9GAMM|nr:DUF2752 domain-containing protein [Lysobacter auxotrophicus]BDU18064.1 DUF2752 domain-containing protein [Lysobacter auxotrophicus]
MNAVASRASTFDMRTVVVGAAAVSALSGAALLRAVEPGALWPCAFHAITGLHCPGCGLTRMLHALVHGDMARAWSMNPLAMIALPLLAMMLMQWWLARPLVPARLNRVVHDGRVWIVAMVLFGVLRNLPFAPLAWMAPG